MKKGLSIVLSILMLISITAGLNSSVYAYDIYCNHTYESTVIKAATCEKSGVKVYLCTKCGYSYEKKIKALGHNYKTNIIKATPKQYGCIDRVCTRCNDEHYKQLGKLSARISNIEYIYNGKVKNPKVYVYSGEACITNDEYSKCYKVIYPKGRKKVGTYTVKIVLVGDYYSGTINKKFKIVKKVKKPAQVKGVTSLITCDYTHESVEYTAKWNKISGISGYQLQFGGEDGGGKYWTGRTIQKGASNNSFFTYCTFGSSEAFNCYAFVKVRAYKKVSGKRVYGKWSKIAYSKSKNIW